MIAHRITWISVSLFSAATAAALHHRHHRPRGDALL